LDSVGAAYGIFKPRNILFSEHGKKTYKYGEDYVKFRVSKRVNGRNTSTEKIYMLMPGLVSMLAASRTHESKQFIRWVCTTIFTVAIGTDDQKLRLFSDSMDVSLAHAHRVLGKCPRVMQGIYYLRISEGLEPLVKDKKIGKLIREAIDDGTVKESDHFIKLGMSKKYDDTEVRRSAHLGLSRRFAEHERGFAKILGTDPKVISFGDILDKQTSSAEKEALDTAREYCRDFSFPGHDEWFILPARKATDFKTAIDNIIREHEITYSDLMTDVEACNKTITDLKASLELVVTKQEAVVSAHEKDMKKLKKIHEIELRSKDELLKSKDEMIDILKASLATQLSGSRKARTEEYEEEEPRRRRKMSRR